ncbi:aspartate-semialdehyde dehydrogenase [candidate division TA06 bacterium]|uniref:Aspartate-semialdehyde dehydrogenase n=1 Tax=candidate division TA06 bacterium TaxID=2250710 RepID=A0A933I7S9_UNCT6|nr:aspartate-semialdehyde dehydrogenase [candidate division TA06 bacterium]
MTRKQANIGLVGATGLVGQCILLILSERRFPVGSLKLWASSRSAGKKIRFGRKTCRVNQIDPDEFAECDLIFFAGTEGEKGASRIFSNDAIRAGVVVIDNGSDYRMDPTVPLVVPEVNPGDALRHRGLIANPNCSTIQMAVALNLIHRKLGLKRIVVSTYQAVSGAGRAGLETLQQENQPFGKGFGTLSLAAQGKNSKFKIQDSAFPRQIACNVIPQISNFSELGFSGEEWKMVKETQKIFHDKKIAVNATAVRVPVDTGHSESVYFEVREKAGLKEIEKLLVKTPGVVFSKNSYHTPLEIAGRDEVFVSRLRPDPFDPKAFVMWVAADNLRKGAATNAVQIAELLFSFH